MINGNPNRLQIAKLLILIDMDKPEELEEKINDLLLQYKYVDLKKLSKNEYLFIGEKK